MTTTDRALDLALEVQRMHQESLTLTDKINASREAVEEELLRIAKASGMVVVPGIGGCVFGLRWPS